MVCPRCIPLFCALLGVALGAGSASAAEDPLRFTITVSPQKNLYAKYIQYVLQEAGARIDRRVELIVLPGRRGAALVEKGVYDGEASRVADYSATHPHLIRVEESQAISYFSAYAASPVYEFTSWDDFKGITSRVGYRMGTMRTSTALPLFVASDYLVKVKSITDGLRMLMAGRMDVFVATRQYVQNEIKHHPEFQAKIHEVGVVERVTDHLFLHEKNAHLAQPFAEALRSMKRDGVLQQLTADIFGETNAVQAQ